MGVLCSDDKVGRFWHQQLTDPGHITNFADTNYECGNHVEVVSPHLVRKLLGSFLQPQAQRHLTYQFLRALPKSIQD
jgi:hypothetical protein